MFPIYSRIKEDINSRYPISVDGHSLDFPFVEDRVLEEPLFSDDENAMGYLVPLTTRLGDQPYSRFYIKINQFHLHAEDCNMAATLCHEYGHFILDFVWAEKSKLIKTLMNKCDYTDYWNKPVKIKTFIVINEFLAWLIGFYFLIFRYQVFNYKSIRYGISCFLKWLNIGY